MIIEKKKSELQTWFSQFLCCYLKEKYPKTLKYRYLLNVWLPILLYLDHIKQTFFTFFTFLNLLLFYCNSLYFYIKYILSKVHFLIKLRLIMYSQKKKIWQTKFYLGHIKIDLVPPKSWIVWIDSTILFISWDSNKPGWMLWLLIQEMNLFDVDLNFQHSRSLLLLFPLWFMF